MVKRPAFLITSRMIGSCRRRWRSACSISSSCIMLIYAWAVRSIQAVDSLNCGSHRRHDRRRDGFPADSVLWVEVPCFGGHDRGDHFLVLYRATDFGAALGPRFRSLRQEAGASGRSWRFDCGVRGIRVCEFHLALVFVPHCARPRRRHDGRASGVCQRYDSAGGSRPLARLAFCWNQRRHHDRACYRIFRDLLGAAVAGLLCCGIVLRKRSVRLEVAAGIEAAKCSTAGKETRVARRLVGVDIEHDELAFFPIIYWPIVPGAKRPTPQTLARIDGYMKQGGTVLFDTRDAVLAPPGPGGEARSPGMQELRSILSSLDIPELEPVPREHVLTKTFFLLRDFPGRFTTGQLWVEALPALDDEELASRPARA